MKQEYNIKYDSKRNIKTIFITHKIQVKERIVKYYLKDITEEHSLLIYSNTQIFK